MAPRRYEISDEQWERIKDMFPRAKPVDDQRIIGRCSMRYYGLQEVVRRGPIFLNVMNHIKQYIVVFANGGTMAPCYAFFEH